ncbi:MAG: (d)CMP kinase [Anaerolineales bacterium]
MSIPQLITIDGPAGSGKSTLGKLLAIRLDYLYFDTGVLYRVVTLEGLRRGENLEDETSIENLVEQISIDVRPASKNDGRSFDVLLDGEDVTWEIRNREVDANVSVVSAYKGVRRKLTEQLRRIAKRGQIVMVGRDIGTIVIPDADLKIYLDASVEVRAKRRYYELQERGENSSFEEVLESMRTRDLIDSTREIAPLEPAEDAIVVDSSSLTIEQVIEKVLGLVNGLREKSSQL